MFNTEQLIQHAKGLAYHQQLASRKKYHFLLARLNHNDKILYEFNKMELVSKKTDNITPATTWLIDNFYLIEEQIQLARLHFPEKYSQELPCLATGQYQNLPRIYSVILELISHVDAQIDEESLQAFIDAYQTESKLKLGELWAVLIMLRLALIENLQRIVMRLQENQLHRDKALVGRQVTIDGKEKTIQTGRSCI